MADGVAGRIDPPSGWLDFRFLNPFQVFLSEGGEKWFGQRYGYAQFVYIATCIACLVILVLQSKEISVIYLISFAFGLFLNYYSVSCLVVPNNHERCFVAVWLSIISMVIFTILLTLGKSVMNSASGNIGIKGGMKNIFKNMSNLLGGDGHETPDEEDQEGGAGHENPDEEYQEGGAGHENPDEEYQEGGRGYGHENPDEEYQEGGRDHENPDEEYQEGGGGYKKSDEEYDVSYLQDRYSGGYNNLKHPDEFDGGASCGSNRKHSHDDDEMLGGASCGSNKKHSHDDEMLGGGNWGKKHSYDDDEMLGGGNWGKKHSYDDDEMLGGGNWGKKHSYDDDEMLGGSSLLSNDSFNGGYFKY